MLRRAIALALLLVLLAAPSAAFAQKATPTPTATPTAPPSGDFGPLPQAAPAEAPTVEPQKSNDSLTQDLGGNRTLFIITGALLVAFVAIGVFISRDARSALPEGHRPGDRLREEGPHKHKREAKAKARQRGKAQKAARRKNR
jgi:hypothetical protein